MPMAEPFRRIIQGWEQGEAKRMALQRPSGLAQLPLMPSAQEPRQAKSLLSPTIMLNKAGGSWGQLVPQPPPGLPKANRIVIQVQAPLLDKPPACQQIRDSVGPGPVPGGRSQMPAPHLPKGGLAEQGDGHPQAKLHNVGGSWGQLVPQPLPGWPSSKPNRRLAWVRAPLQEKPTDHQQIKDSVDTGPVPGGRSQPHEAGRPWGHLVPRPPPGRPSPNRRLVRVRVPLQNMPPRCQQEGDSVGRGPVPGGKSLDALRVKQHQEAKETEWLYREMEAMLKQSHLERASVIQAQQNRSSFQQILREQALKEQRQQEKWATQRMVDAKDIQHQMQKYQEKLACERVVSFEDKKHLQKERQWHADHIAQLKRQRIEELRATSPPEKYCLGVECVGLMKPGPKDRGSLRTAQPMPGDFQGVMCGLPPA
ncbi:hypothetical protein Y1Q_0010440 [Alligator mississippiensis]|uniref:Uncharacterized protein n=1 Tax=Alligator mississippiensis TaxID=8496 RepID=A0A151NWG1_ALLMI|nr:hypothetical protein Y1Q_0010440 [Alligator mississippiensis]